VGFSHRATETQRAGRRGRREMEEVEGINNLTEKIIGCAI
jgi:hypothetical protein